MIKPIHAMLRILQGKIILDDGTDVRIVKREYPIDKTPCITIDDSGGTAIVQKHITNKDYTLSPSHPQYDETNPDKTISQQVIREERTITMELNIWCDNEDERDEITDKIRELFYQVQSDHYKFCNNYNNGNCKFLNRSCEATSPDSMRGIKNQCPKPYDYHYQNIFKTYDIIRATFDVAPPYILDDITTTPPVRRSIIRVSFGYYDYYRIGGAVSDTLFVDEELLWQKQKNLQLKPQVKNSH